MPLDPSIFYNFAALKQRQNEQLQSQVTSGLDLAQKDKALKAEAAKQGVDLDKLIGPVLVKANSGQPLTDQDKAVVKSWDMINTTKLAQDPTGNYRKINASILGGGGLNLGALTPQSGGASPALPGMPETALPDVGGTISKSGPPALGPALNMAQLGLPAMDDSIQQDNGDALPVADNLGPVAPKQSGFDLSAVQPQPQTPITVPPELASNPNAAQKYLESAASKAAETDAKTTADQPAKAEDVATSIAQLDNLNQTIDDAVGMVNPQTAGFGSNIKDMKIPFTNIDIGAGSKAKDLDGLLTTIKADATLSTLKQMKAQSPTGASGMGALSDTEGKLVAAQTAALNQDQSPAQLVKSLNNYKKVRNEAIARMKDFYQKQYGPLPDAKTGGKTGAVSYQEYFK